MSGASRREAIRTFGVLALAPVVGLSAQPVSAQTLTPVSAPAGRFILSRRLVRGLSDGKAIVVERDWECAFSATQEGLVVSGQQIAVQVDAPQKLAPLADIERRREVAGLFPARLDSFGRMQTQADTSSDADVALAVDRAMAIYRQEGRDTETQDAATAFLRSLTKAGAAMVSQIPQDLFFPSTTPQHETRQITLPNGQTGAFEIVAKAEAESTTGLLKRRSRDVVTRVAASAIRSSENWSLTPV